MKIFFSALPAFALSGILSAQQPTTISGWRQQLERAKTPYEKAECMGSLAYLYTTLRQDSAQFFAKACLDLGKETGNAHALAYGWIANGWMQYAIHRKIDSAIVLAEKGLRIAEENNDKTVQGLALMNLGSYRKAKAEIALAKWYYEQAEQIAKETKNATLLMNLNYNIARLLNTTGEKSRHFSYLYHAVHLADSLGRKDALFQCYDALYKGYYGLGDVEKATEYATKLYDLSNYDELIYYKAHGLKGTAMVAALQKDYDKAEPRYLAALGIYEKVGAPEDKGNIYLDLAHFYFHYRKNHKLARQFAEKGIEVGAFINLFQFMTIGYTVIRDIHYANKQWSEVDDMESKILECAKNSGNAWLIRDTYYDRAWSRRSRGDMQGAWDNFYQYKLYADSVYNISTLRQTAELEANTKFEKEKAAKDRELLELKNINLESELHIRQQADEIFRNKTEAEKREILLQLLNSDNEIQSLSLRRKDDSLSTQQLRMELERSNNNAQIAQKEATLAQRNRVIGLLAGLLALGGLAVYVLRLRQRAAQQRRVAEVEMRALRAQMNPHFLFNSMNAINSYIVRNDTQAASEYLSQFAAVMRRILESAQSPTVTLEKELELLEQYLQVEQKRIPQGFDYQIRVADEVETRTRVPSMILQPFVENAVWHGIRPKSEGRGLVQIAVAQQPGGRLQCSIEDNGVGRKPAHDSSGSKSLGLKITADRLALWHNGDVKTPLQFTDLKNGEGESCGTRVEVVI